MQTPDNYQASIELTQESLLSKAKPNNYVRGLSWFILSLTISNMNDVAMKFLGSDLPHYEIVFLRFAFGVLSLLPLIMIFGKQTLKSEKPAIHLLRGVLLFVSISIWCFGLQFVPIANATLVNFTIPLFTLILARIFLREKLGFPRIIATLFGFIGVLIVIMPLGLSFQPSSFLLLISALMFSMLDIINKKFVVKEHMIAMLFYSSVVTLVLSGAFAISDWKTPSLFQFFILGILGIGSNAVLYCVLKAFRLMDASAVSPYRYFELLISAFFGYVIFNEKPDSIILLGAMFIIPSLFFIAKYESVES